MNSSKQRNNRVLVVDDEVDVLEFVRIYLESMGWEVKATSSVAEAFEELAKLPYFLVITDIAMPEMDGYEFINAIKTLGYGCQFALMTGFGYNPKHTLVKIYKTVKYPCLFKPFNREKVMMAVKEAFELYHKDIDDGGGDGNNNGGETNT
jgi:DNA-binding NtrC family response regulator